MNGSKEKPEAKKVQATQVIFDINTATMEVLKAAVYDEQIKVNIAKRNMQVLENAIAQKAQGK